MSRLPWPIRSVVAGAAGTGALTLAYAVEHRLRPQVNGPLDYDDSLVPGEIVASSSSICDTSPATRNKTSGCSCAGATDRCSGSRTGCCAGGWIKPEATIVFAGLLISLTVTIVPAASGGRRHRGAGRGGISPPSW